MYCCREVKKRLEREREIAEKELARQREEERKEALKAAHKASREKLQLKKRAAKVLIPSSRKLSTVNSRRAFLSPLCLCEN